MNTKLAHLVWIPAAGLVGFLAAYLFGDRITLPVDVYYLIYFMIVIGFCAYYVTKSGLDWRLWSRRRLVWGVVLGVLIGLVMLGNVLSRPETPRLTGASLAWAVFWRGLVYGGVDGLLLFAFPWIVAWRAFEAESSGWRRKVGASLVSWVCILLVTTLYHLGYSDFRSVKIVQPNIGSTIMAVPTLVSANPLSSPISHVFLHVAAVVHSPQTELFLPPHRGTDQPREQR